MRWLAEQFEAIMDQLKRLPQMRQPAAATSKAKPAPASRPERVSRRIKPPAAPSPAQNAVVPLQPLPRIDVDISFAVDVDLSPMLKTVGRAPEPEGRWWELREQFAHLGLAQGFDELLCLPPLQGVEAFWYQVETVRKVLKQFRGRVLLADEVGLGKTIEAGMVLKEYMLRGMAETRPDPDPGLAGRAMARRDGGQVRHRLRHHARSVAAQRSGRRSGRSRG